MGSYSQNTIDAAMSLLRGEEPTEVENPAQLEELMQNDHATYANLVFEMLKSGERVDRDVAFGNADVTKKEFNSDIEPRLTNRFNGNVTFSYSGDYISVLGLSNEMTAEQVLDNKIKGIEEKIAANRQERDLLAEPMSKALQAALDFNPHIDMDKFIATQGHFRAEVLKDIKEQMGSEISAQDLLIELKERGKTSSDAEGLYDVVLRTSDPSEYDYPTMPKKFTDADAKDYEPLFNAYKTLETQEKSLDDSYFKLKDELKALKQQQELPVDALDSTPSTAPTHANN